MSIIPQFLKVNELKWKLIKKEKKRGKVVHKIYFKMRSKISLALILARLAQDWEQLKSLNPSPIQ